MSGRLSGAAVVDRKSHAPIVAGGRAARLRLATPAMELLARVRETSLDAEQIAAQGAAVRAAVLASSRQLRTPRFARIHTSDLRLVFEQYDARVFAGAVARHLGETRVRFGLSARMTSAGGKTVRWTNRREGLRWFEIRVSTSILFGCFEDDDHRPIHCCGLVCHDRLDALQRIMEHEIVHLLELLLWGRSRCARPRFQSIARRFFGHTEHTHALITPRERAFVRFGVHPGATVRFRLDGTEHVGVVNRIGQRVTVLVPDRSGPRYSDGRHYAKFYVPVGALERVE